MDKKFRKYLIYSLSFLITGLLCGVYFREFSKYYNQVNMHLTLGLVHVHLLVLGMIMFLLIGLINIKLNKDENKYMKYLLPVYATSTYGAGLMLLVRGTLDVLIKANVISELSSGINGMISGISGLFHIILGISIVLIFIIWIKKPQEENK